MNVKSGWLTEYAESEVDGGDHEAPAGSQDRRVDDVGAAALPRWRLDENHHRRLLRTGQYSIWVNIKTFQLTSSFSIFEFEF